MDEIKFRAKRRFDGNISNLNKWVHGLYRRFKNSHYIDNTPIELGTLGQYIKKKDKNGVEIYESDIITGAYKDMLGYNAGEIKGVVIFNNGEIVVNDGITSYLLRDIKDLQVIGNKFDNTELLNK